MKYIWSLNFDDLLESARVPPAKVISSDIDMRGSLGFDHPVVVKMHGGLADLRAKGDSRDIVITRDDFDRYVEKFTRTWSRLLADFHTKSMLFVGISFADPNMQQLLRLVRTASGPVTQQHYAIVGPPRKDASRSDLALRTLQQSDLRRGGVEAVELASFNDLPTVLERLAIAARQPNVLVSGDIKADDDRGHAFLEALGIALASSGDLNLVHGGGIAGTTSAQSFAQHLGTMGEYDSTRIHMIRRSKDASMKAPRHGHITFPGPDRADVRRTLCHEASIVVAIGGGSGTQAELDEADRQEIEIIAVPFSPGVARDRWERDKATARQPNVILKGLEGLSVVAAADVVARVIRRRILGEEVR